MADLVITGQEQLLAALQRLGNPALNRAVLEAGARMLAGKFKTYPTVRRLTRESVYGEMFVSDRQRRFFFWALRNGVIQVPYYRGQNPKSENLQQSWNVVITSDTTASVGTGVSYAPLAMDAERQSKYLQAVGWRTVQQIVQVEEPAVQTAMTGVLASQAHEAGWS